VYTTEYISIKKSWNRKQRSLISKT